MSATLGVDESASGNSAKAASDIGREPRPSASSEPTKPGTGTFLDEWLAKRRTAKDATGPGPLVDEVLEASEAASSQRAAAERESHPRLAPAIRRPTVRSRSQLLGPMVKLDRVAARWGTTEQALVNRARSGQLLILTTTDGVRTVPRSHLTDEGLISGLQGVVEALQGVDMTEWSKAAWLASPRRDLARQSVLKWLAEGGDVAMVDRLVQTLGFSDG